MLQTLIASDSKTVTNATHVRGQVGSRALIVPTHTNHLSTTCLPHVRLETRLPVGTKFREGWSLGTRLRITIVGRSIKTLRTLYKLLSQDYNFSKSGSKIEFLLVNCSITVSVRKIKELAD